MTTRAAASSERRAERRRSQRPLWLALALTVVFGAVELPFRAFMADWWIAGRDRAQARRRGHGLATLVIATPLVTSCERSGASRKAKVPEPDPTAPALTWLAFPMRPA